MPNFAFLLLFSGIFGLDVDQNGYMVYCPCMGRFGNQAEHFLGSLAVAKAIDRSLILPPWIQFDYAKPNSSQIPFDTYFMVEQLQQYHRVITMERFMDEIAPTIWPEPKRYSFCWSPRPGTNNNDCNAKDGNPFGPFWDHFRINFVGSQFYGSMEDRQLSFKYPPADFPVLAFVGAPARFPMLEEHRILHRYLKWSSQIEQKSKNFIKNVLPDGPFLGLHLRNDLDWINVCKHVPDSTQLFSSAQCLGYNNERGKLTFEICNPDVKLIMKQTKRVAKALNIKSVFVASDRNHLINEFNAALKDIGVKAFKLEVNEPQVDLAILGKATYFVGNCVSSFSAFVKRERDVNTLPSGFWGIDENGAIIFRDEL